MIAFAEFNSLLRPTCQDALGTRPHTGVKLLVVLEGQHDVTFFHGISRILHTADATLPDLGALARAGVIVILPVGGGDVLAWAARMAALGVPEFHLFDREVSPATERRQKAIEIVNQRSNCRGYLTQKRALENYLHPHAVEEVSGIELGFGDDDDVADLVARLLRAASPRTCLESIARAGSKTVS